jgi:hypothetical protein
MRNLITLLTLLHDRIVEHETDVFFDEYALFRGIPADKSEENIFNGMCNSIKNLANTGVITKEESSKLRRFIRTHAPSFTNVDTDVYWWKPVVKATRLKWISAKIDQLVKDNQLD